MSRSACLVLIALSLLLAPTSHAEDLSPEQVEEALFGLPRETLREIKEGFRVVSVHGIGGAKEIRGLSEGVEHSLILNETGSIVETRDHVGRYIWVEVRGPGGEMREVKARLLENGERLEAAQARRALPEFAFLRCKAELAALSESQRAKKLKGAPVGHHCSEQAEMMAMFVAELLTDD